MIGDDYVHGYSEKENARLFDQARTLTGIIHGGTSYPAGSRVLEAGCGVGAQTVTLARNSPEARIVSIDLSEESLRKAERLCRREDLSNVEFRVADIHKLPFAEGSFDHVFVCFTLEHLPDPHGGLVCLKRVIKEGGSITAVEGDHGSACFHPDSAWARKAIDCLIRIQADLGGDSLIGRRLYPLLKGAGFREVRVRPRMVYVDASRPELVEGFTKNTFTAMVEGVREKALALGLVDAPAWEKGIADLYRTAEDDGTFCYTFFKGVGRK